MNNSYWWESLPQWTALPTVSESADIDVAIIGAGYTGLWSAYFLMHQNPLLKIQIFEKEHVGFGASGRNGGWVSSLWPVSLSKISATTDPKTARDFQLILNKVVQQFGETLRTENIDADFNQAGTVNLARSASQLQRLRAEVADYREFGFGKSDYDLVEDLAQLPNATNTIAGLISPHCASIQPAKLVRNLAKVVLDQGTDIFENSAVTRLAPHKISVNGHNVTAKYVLVATEGYRHELIHRVTAPIHSLMFISDPIPADLIESIRLKPGQTFNDARNLIIYGQLTADNRIAFGGRGAPYRLGSKTGASTELHRGAFNYLNQTLIEMFPDLTHYVSSPSHYWGGPIGVSRDWQPSINYNPDTGIITAGNYVGDGVAASYLAGQTIADLITKTKSELTQLPWVNHKSRKWEIEPIRYILINAARILISTSDLIEQKLGKETVLTKVLWRLLKG
jgi:glycine/D-amino acid oxidase-like deaminating enzyme